ncbi:CDP-alcohol phosphatidyltransferase family protein [Dactylosporangium aurantiacum]|uniref:CDP-alcohol phosphatidyltransferase family protein n=1 Tax=Dactylosporangium aurantiacum TaxID=35754 RepID=A0A9Q9IET1_9ACTN|nr:CDP-alcohol phosphatidyltransferase family protein [Dactylosporangium aurantiacum]MDG6102482.1 CDP-alcohol phosphatidyltransferase family protein [Dactylosporangium aurantiacum]UWZ53238.1 CDP-alcohol phosphatidyltransferase family protein [Dactylosporangium aurantiacum]
MSAHASDVRDWDGYAERWAAAHGGYDPRSASPLVRGWLRISYELGAALTRIGVRSPNAVTVLGLLLSAAVPVAVAGGRGWALAGAVLVLLSAVADTVDGVLAVVTGRASRLGQVYDSAADRVAEACWLLALVILGGPAWLAAACCALMWLHEYVRARATVAGMSDIGTVTVAERPTRVLVTIFGLLAVGVAALAGRWQDTAALAVLVVMAVLGAAGFVQLIAGVRRALS